MPDWGEICWIGNDPAGESAQSAAQSGLRYTYMRRKYSGKIFFGKSVATRVCRQGGQRCTPEVFMKNTHFCLDICMEIYYSAYSTRIMRFCAQRKIFLIPRTKRGKIIIIRKDPPDPRNGAPLAAFPAGCAARSAFANCTALAQNIGFVPLFYIVSRNRKESFCLDHYVQETH